MATKATEAPTLELVLKRNSVERLKREKSPLRMLEELPALIAAGIEASAPRTSTSPSSFRERTSAG
jgi:hypothetical protein